MSIMNQFRLDNKVAVITGGGRGIGAACARAFAEAGADVVIAARTQSQLDAVAADIKDMGRRVLTVVTDVMEEAQLQRLVDATMEEFDRLDILVNNAGGFPPKPMADTSLKEFDAAFRFNVSTAFALTRIATPHLAAGEETGAVINISSIAGHAPSSWFTAYGTAKSSLSYLSQVMAQELAPRIRVNAIAVGSTKTDALNTVLTPEIEKTMVDLTPMARLGEVEDIAACALYLASPAASYLTGDIINVNGGLTNVNMTMPRAFD